MSSKYEDEDGIVYCKDTDLPFSECDCPDCEQDRRDAYEENLYEQQRDTYYFRKELYGT